MKNIILSLCFLIVNLSASILEVPSEKYPTIQSAIDSAGTADTVQVLRGFYQENLNFHGKQISVTSLFWQSADQTDIDSTIIDGGFSGSVFTFQNGEDSLAILNGFTIRNGYNSGGGGIYCDNGSSPMLQNLIIADNFASNGGGIFCFGNADPKLINITLLRNKAIYTGGAISASQSCDLNMVNVQIMNNTANEDGGGIILSDSSSMTISNIHIQHNLSWWSGGGMHIRRNSSVNITGGEISNNYALDYGGGIFASESILNLENTVLESDTAGSGGGIFLELCDTSEFSNTLISDNRAVTSGGGIYLYESSPVLKSVNIFRNSAAEEGGGINIAYSTPQFDLTQLCNIYENHAGFDGNDLYADTDLLVEVVLDTFTLNSSDPYLVYPEEIFNLSVNSGLWSTSENDLYVNPLVGNNSNDGLTSGTPLRTIAAALTKSTGDSLHINLSAGTYMNSVNGEFFPINLKKNTALIGTNPGETVLDAGGWEAVIAVRNDSNCVVENVFLTNGNGYITGGILADQSEISIRNVVLAHNTGTQGSAVHARNSTIINMLNTTISNNGQSTILAGPSAFGGIYLKDSRSRIANSIIWGNEGFDLSINGESSSAALAFCDMDTISGKPGGSHSDQIFWLAENLSTSPMFVDSIQNDYRLGSGSPCIDAGDQDRKFYYNTGNDSLLIPVLVFQGEAPDLGAFEYNDPAIVVNESRYPNKFSLDQNYPNPFNPHTTIQYTLPHRVQVRLEIFDILGQRVQVVFDQVQNAGAHTIRYQNSTLPTGIYYYRLSGPGYSAVRKMILIK